MPLRFSRPVMALIATGTAAVMVAVSGMPAAVAAARAPTGAPQASGQFSGEAGTPIAILIAGRGYGAGGTSGFRGVAPAAEILSIPAATAAMLITPKGRRAGAGARPLVSPTAVPGAPTSQGLGSQVLRAGEISAALFAALLLLIIAYAATGRRRRRTVSSALVTAEWAHRHGQSRYPQATAADADRMLEVFATPVPEPERAGPASPAGIGGSVGSRAGDGLRAVSRRPQVSGTPPWDAASAPNSELPWTATADRQSVGSDPAAAALPGGQTGQLGQESWLPGEPAGPSQFGPAGQQDPYYASQPGWRLAGSQARPGWDSPGASPGAARGEPPGGSPAQRAGDGWDGRRWNPSPSVGPVIEGSVLNSGSADRGRGAAASYPSQYSQPGQYSQPDEYSRPGQYSQPDEYSQPGQYSQPDEYSQPGQDWPGPQGPEQPRIAPSGLPIRTPRPATSASPPRSPSGSLWERAESQPGGYQDPSGHQATGGYQNTGQERGRRPIYVWKPTDGSSDPGYPPASQ